MKFIDTHAHLYSDAFDEDRDIMMERAFSLGIDTIALPAIDSGSTDAMYKLEKQYPKNIHVMMGLHPTSVKENYLDEIAHVKKQLEQRRFCAIGEIGVDLYWDNTFIKEQVDAFRIQIRLAKEYGLPIAIHCRDAFDEIFDVLEEEKGEELYGVFHCFTGTKEQALRAISYNMKLGIGGVVTFKNGKIDQFLNEIGIENLVLETDAPYLSPVPFRGKRNESSYLKLVAEKIAEIYGLPIEEVARITTLNAKRTLGI